VNASLHLLHADAGVPWRARRATASVRRVASAVGGGGIAVQLVHLRLAELAG